MTRAPDTFSQWLKQKTYPQSLCKTDNLLPILVVGAGPAGLVVMKELKAKDIPFEGVESHQSVGGNWDISNPHSSAYESLITNSSKVTTHLGDAFPKECPAYLPRETALNYLIDFSKRHSLNEHIRLRTNVIRVTKTSRGTWMASFKGVNGELSEREFRAVIVATGINSKINAIYPKPLWDSALAQGISVIHSSDYKTPEPFKGKRVLILGIGNSGAEIATELSRHCEKVFISVRTTPWIVPLWVRGVPADEFVQNSKPTFHWLDMWIFHRLQRYYVGHPSKIGFKKPKHDLLDKLPIADRGIVKAISEGTVQIRSQLSHIERGEVQFEKEAPEPVDAIIFATGYRRQYPFLSKEVCDFENPEFNLTFHLLHPYERGLVIFNELIAPQGVWPIYSEQAKMVASYFAAEAADHPSMQILDSLRLAPAPDFKGHLFCTADRFHIDPKIYTNYLKEFVNWVNG